MNSQQMAEYERKEADRAAEGKRTPEGACRWYRYETGLPLKYSCTCAGWDCDLIGFGADELIALTCSPAGCVSRVLPLTVRR